METLGYSAEWREIGVVSDAVIETQANQWEKPDADRHAEHYRYGTWKAFLSKLDALPIPLLKALLLLDLREASMAGTPSSSFGHGIAYDLASHSALTLDGLELLRRHPIDAVSFARALDRAHHRLTKAANKA
jgi:hypothetical protein